jgi:mono/diheme cytochrome c family protein
VLVAAAFALLLAAAETSVVRAQGPAPNPEAGLWAGAYQDAQADRGAALYRDRCSRCHAVDLAGGQIAALFAPELTGEPFMARWESNTVGRLYTKIKDDMPRGDVGTLDADATVDLVAYILRHNGFPAGARALEAGNALDAFVILPRTGATDRPVANFAMVHVTGCVVRGNDGRLHLVQAGRPIVARQGLAGTNVALGTDEYRLVSAAIGRFDPSTGKAVRVRGRLRRDADEVLLNVADAEVVDVTCAVNGAEGH